MTFLPALFLDFILTDLVIVTTYVLFVFVWELIFPPKTKEQQKEEEEAKGLLANQEVMVGAEKKQE